MAVVAVNKELEDIDAKMKKLQDRRKAVLKKSGERVVKLAGEAGLLELSLSDADLLGVFKEAAGRFRGASGGTKSAQAGATKAQEPAKARLETSSVGQKAAASG